MTDKSRLRRTLSRWASPDDQHARDMRREFAADEAGLDRIGDAADRQRVRLRGTLRTVTLRPRGGVPALEAELYDGTGSITVIWLGRRQITGVNPGRSLEIQGRVGRHDGQRIMYNPRYELMP
jgi:hypothetical protein